MSNVKITDLTEITKPATGDWFPIVDVSDSTQSIQGSTRKIKFENISAATVYVSATGTNDHTVLQSAIDAAENGSLYIKAGTYDIGDTVLIPSNIRIFGDGSKTILKANASLVVTKNMLANEDQTSGNINIHISRLKLDGNQANRSGSLDENAGSNLYFKKVSYSEVNNIITTNGFSCNLTVGPGSHHNKIIGNEITNSHWHNILILGAISGPVYTYENIVVDNLVDTSGVGNASEGAGIEVSKHAVRNVFSNNTSSNNKEGGLHLFYRSNNNTVIGNSFYNNGGAGVYIVDESDYNAIIGNIISNSQTTGVGGTTAFLARTGNYSVIAKNIIVDCQQNGIRGSFVGATIDGNTINNCGAGGTNTTQHGVYLTSITDMRFINNRITSSTSRGGSFVDISNSSIKNNYFGSNTSNGLLIDYSATGLIDTVIEGNVFQSNGGSGLVLFKGAKRCSISNNISRSNTGIGIDIRGADHCAVIGNSLSGNSTYGLLMQNDAASTGVTHCTVNGNIVTTNTSGGIREQGAADYNIYTSNNCNGNTTANFATVGANDVSANNITS